MPLTWQELGPGIRPDVLVGHRSDQAIESLRRVLHHPIGLRTLQKIPRCESPTRFIRSTARVSPCCTGDTPVKSDGSSSSAPTAPPPISQTGTEIVYAISGTSTTGHDPRGFGFVTMSTAEEAQKAINALNGKELGGRALTVNVAKPREERAPGGGGGRREYGGGGGGGGRNRY